MVTHPFDDAEPRAYFISIACPDYSSFSLVQSPRVEFHKSGKIVAQLLGLRGVGKGHLPEKPRRREGESGRSGPESLSLPLSSRECPENICVPSTSARPLSCPLDSVQK